MLYSITNIKTNSKIFKNIQKVIYDLSSKEKIAFENQEIARKRIEESAIYRFREVTKRTNSLFKKGRKSKDSFVNNISIFGRTGQNRKHAIGSQRKSVQRIQQSTSKYNNGRRLDFLQEDEKSNYSQYYHPVRFLLFFFFKRIFNNLVIRLIINCFNSSFYSIRQLILCY